MILGTRCGQRLSNLRWQEDVVVVDEEYSCRALGGRIALIARHCGGRGTHAEPPPMKRDLFKLTHGSAGLLPKH